MLPVSRNGTYSLQVSKHQMFECDKYGYIVRDCPDRIPPSGTPVHQHKKEANTRHCSRSSSRHHHQSRHKRSRSQSHHCRYYSHSHHDWHRSHSRSHHKCHHQNTSRGCHSSTYHHCHDTPHCRSSSHRSTSACSRDCSRSESHSTYRPSKMTQFSSSSRYNKSPGRSLSRKHHRVTIDNPQTDFYSSGESSNSDNEDCLN